MSPLILQPMTAEQVTTVSNLCRRVFLACNAPHMPEKGSEHFLGEVIPTPILLKRMEQSHFVVAKEGGHLSGIAEIRPPGHLALLFVDVVQQGSGIGRALVEYALDYCRNTFAANEYLTLNAAPNTIPFYERLGFEATDEEQIINGIRFVPMRKRF